MMDGSAGSGTTPEYKVIGTRPVRHDGVDKVTGRAEYGNDVKIPGTVYARVLRSPHAHARIKSIDTSKAEKHPGFLAVVTSADFPEPPEKVEDLGEDMVNIAHLSANCLARGKVLYKGQAVAAVAARSLHEAQEAVQLLEVEYEELQPITWVTDGMKDDAPLIHDDVYTDAMGKIADKPSNVAKHFHFEIGDPAKGFEDADVVIEREYKTATVHQGYIEPHACTAHWNSDGDLKIWTTTQGSFVAQLQTAEVLCLPVSTVTVTPTEIGGGFGGKISIYLEPVAAVLSKKCGRPVKIAMDRADVFEATGPTPASVVRVKLGAKKDGTLVAGESWMAFEAGAFPGSPVACGCMCVFSCYDIPNAVVDGFDVVVNKPRTQAYRAPGSTHVCLATEAIMDDIARELGMDPLELRFKNAAKEGTERVDGLVYPRVGCVEVLDALKSSPHWNSPLEGPNRGRGFGLGFWFNIGRRSSVTVHVNTDGTVNLVEGCPDIGGSRTSLSMQLAETLGIPVEDVHPKIVDTQSVGFNAITAGSRITMATGMAVYNAGLVIREKMAERAAILWECDAADVEYDDGTFRNGDKSISFKDLAGRLDDTGGPLSANGEAHPMSSSNAFGAHLVDVEVDPETGKVTVLRYTTIQDAGKAIYPPYVEGQMQGGATQGIGWALNEEYVYDEKGRMANPTFLDYRIPTCLDLPMIDTIIVEVPNPDHPYGVRGVGETPIVPPPAALANAIYNATGVHMTELPMSPPRLCAAILEKEGASL